MEQDGLLKRNGIYGKHPRLDEYVEAVEKRTRGATSTQLKSELGLSRQTFAKITAQAQALGLVDVEGGGKTGELRVFKTPNEQLLFQPGTTHQEIEDQVTESLEKLTNDEGVQNATFKVSIQKIES